MTREQQDRLMLQTAVTIGLMLFCGAVSLAASYIAMRMGLLNPSDLEFGVAVVP